MELVDLLAGVLGAVCGWASGAFKAWLRALPRRGVLKEPCQIPEAPPESGNPPLRALG